MPKNLKGEEPKIDEGLDIPSDVKIEIKEKKVDVLDRRGAFIRSYSEEKHGKGYLDLAKMFIGKPLNAAKGYRLA